MINQVVWIWQYQEPETNRYRKSRRQKWNQNNLGFLAQPKTHLLFPTAHSIFPSSWLNIFYRSFQNFWFWKFKIYILILQSFFFTWKSFPSLRDSTPLSRFDIYWVLRAWKSCFLHFIFLSSGMIFILVLIP